jgi:hypothetical protein
MNVVDFRFTYLAIYKLKNLTIIDLSDHFWSMPSQNQPQNINYKWNPKVLVSLDSKLNSTFWIFLKLNTIMRFVAHGFLFNLDTDWKF